MSCCGIACRPPTTPDVVVDRRIVHCRAQLSCRAGLARPRCVCGAPRRLVVQALGGGRFRRTSKPTRRGRKPPLADASMLRFRSAAATDVGRVRQINQDAFVERPEVGLWAVADGLGGHSDGEYASRMVCDAFADFAPSPSLDDMVDAARERMHEVNDHLFRTSTRSLLADRSCQHRRGPADARRAMRRPLGGRQPRLSLANGPARTADARSQSGRIERSARGRRRRTPSRVPWASIRA